MSSNKLNCLTIAIIFSFSLNNILHAQLKSNSNQADYIVITPSQFVGTLQPFITWRESKGFNVKTVELQNIYSEFPDSTWPSSIRDFVSYSLTYWQDPKPKYILLVGGAKLLPTYRVASMFATEPSLHEDSVSIDEWYAVNLFDSDTKPDVAIGRFPVNDEQELKNVISKTICFEDSLSFEDYPTDFIILTDKKDYTAFESYANTFIKTKLPSDYSKDTIFAAQDSSIAFTRDHLFKSLSKGALFLSYYGHGAPESWSEYNIFTSKDVDSLKADNLPFIFTSSACSQPFDIPNDSSIVRMLMVMQKSGTVAAINTTGINFSVGESDFLSKFYETIFNKYDIAIGDATLQTKLYLESSLGNYLVEDAILRRYTLLGDPALKLPHKISTKVADDMNEIPNSYSLKQNYPNPFNPTTIIDYTIPQTSIVTLKVYDLLGREVSTLVNEEKQPGNYEVMFDGSSLASGIYFYNLQAGNYTDTKKMILLK